MTDAAGKTLEADMTDDSQWEVKHGTWKQENGVYTQTTNENRTALLWKLGKVKKGSVIEFEVNKLSGSEGFLFYFGLQDLRSCFDFIR